MKNWHNYDIDKNGIVSARSAGRLSSCELFVDDDAHVVMLTVGESSGKASRSVATYTPGPAGMAYAQDASTSAVSEIGRAKMVRNSSAMLCYCEIIIVSVVVFVTS